MSTDREKRLEEIRDSTHWVECWKVHDRCFLLSEIDRLERELSEASKWKEEVIDALIVNFIYTKEHENDPLKALTDLVEWEQKLSLDPKVSEPAAKLVRRAEALEGALRREWWSNHGAYARFTESKTHGPYGDDGEMQCCGVDFLRMPFEELAQLVEQMRWESLAKAAALSPQPTPPEGMPNESPLYPEKWVPAPEEDTEGQLLGGPERLLCAYCSYPREMGHDTGCAFLHQGRYEEYLKNGFF